MFCALFLPVSRDNKRNLEEERDREIIRKKTASSIIFNKLRCLIKIGAIFTFYINWFWANRKSEKGATTKAQQDQQITLNSEPHHHHHHPSIHKTWELKMCAEWYAMCTLLENSIESLCVGERAYVLFHYFFLYFFLFFFSLVSFSWTFKRLKWMLKCDFERFMRICVCAVILCLFHRVGVHFVRNTFTAGFDSNIFSGEIT